ncbi:MlaD family protein [Candidatus Kapabacteria bacterium]|nr:MlaD family protein [Candidatus Kapabacteria bacterium]
MNSNKTNEIKVGIVTLIAIGIAIFGFAYVNNSGMDKQNTVQFLFERSAGLGNSAPIMINGVERGKVTQVENYDGKVKVTGYVDNKNDLNADASAKIMILEITGGKKIEINPGMLNQPFTSEFIPGNSVSDLSELVSIVSDVSGDAINLIRRLDTISIAINRLITDTSFVNNVVETADGANKLVKNANSFFDKNSRDMSNLITNLEDISIKLNNSIDKNEPKVSKIIDDLDLAISNANTLIESADKTTSNINNLLSDLDKIINDIKTEKSIVNKLLYDKEFAAKLDSAFTDLGSFVKIIEQHGVNVNLRIGTRP